MRLWFRRLESDFFGPLLQPRYFHTWIEAIPSSPRRSDQAVPLAVGIYDKSTPLGSSRAVLMHQGWEYEEEQVRRFRPGFVTVELPGFDARDLRSFADMAHDDARVDLGPYAYLTSFGRLIGLEARNCMTWVAEFVRERGFEGDAIEVIGDAFAAHLEGH